MPKIVNYTHNVINMQDIGLTLMENHKETGSLLGDWLVVTNWHVVHIFFYVSILVYKLEHILVNTIDAFFNIRLHLTVKHINAFIIPAGPVRRRTLSTQHHGM